MPSKTGQFAGYTMYRYGYASGPITLAGPQFQRPSNAIFRGRKRQSLIERTMDVLSDWRKSPFENEGAVLAGIRAGLCELGHGWAKSDLQAWDAVSAALRLMGAERPSFEEGQPGYSLGSEYCHWCYGPIDEDEQRDGRRFCSVDCARIGVQRMARKTNHHYGAVLRSALRLIDRDKAKPRQCAYCEREYKTDDRTQRFCSPRCVDLSRVTLHIRNCAICERPFKPWRHGQRYCGDKCKAHGNIRAERIAYAGERRICQHCQEEYQPRRKVDRYCSKKCQQDAGQKRSRARKKEIKLAPRPCKWCGGIFRPNIASGEHCSPRCSKDSSLYKNGHVPKRLNWRVFDHYIALPAEEYVRRRLTPQKYDWMALEAGIKLTGAVELPRAV